MRHLLAVIIFFVTPSFWTDGMAQTSIEEILEKKVPVGYKGKAIDAYKFKDTLGYHLFLVTKIKDTINHKTSIAAIKYSMKAGTYMKAWEIKDFADEILLHYKYTKIIDLDKDGICETIFVYQLNPDYGEGSDWKVMLHYKDKKYILRAHVPELDFDKYSVSLDKSFGAIPASFKKYVTSYWNKIVKELNLKTI